MNNDGQNIVENVGPHYEENYTKIDTEPVGSKTSATMFHDFNAVKCIIPSIFFIVICN